MVALPGWNNPSARENDAADNNIHGYFLMEDESQRQQEKRYLHADRVSIENPYGAPISSRKDESFASNIMFHIGGFYMALTCPGIFGPVET